MYSAEGGISPTRIQCCLGIRSCSLVTTVFLILFAFHTQAADDGEDGALWLQTIQKPAAWSSETIPLGDETRADILPAIIDPARKERADWLQLSFFPKQNIARELQMRSFGVEERVVAERFGSGFIIRCAPGEKPAGAIFRSDSRYFPREIQADIMVLSSDVEGQIGVVFVQSGKDANQSQIRYLSSDPTRITIPPLTWSTASEQYNIILICPPEAASAKIDSLSVEPRSSELANTSAGAWIWNTNVWLDQPEALVEWAQRMSLSRLFLQVQISAGTENDSESIEVDNADALRGLVRFLHDRGFSVSIVEGDPAMILPQGRDYALQRLYALRRYQEASDSKARFDGIQFDIEPYVLREFFNNEERIWGDWARSLQDFEEAWGDKVSVAVPFWMMDSKPGFAALDTILPHISEIVVMAYRTEAEPVLRISESWLAWGQFYETRVSIALENGPLSLEESWLRHTDSTVSEQGEPITIIGTGRHKTPVYVLPKEEIREPGRVSFMNDLERLAEVRSQLEDIFSAWSSFEGILLHGL